ncbi:UDP-3-O-acyl-N-acetylglucosamine deacetylase [Aquabacter spiritensis]|uniref:UDP-3-O-acyl-N-acetylglucosamine deacetylase n=1 Tax=Aquabacter spiritensis TaxID=933073 RepID=A0A4R3M0X7_9HYPH|nr:UDP-3-O-acyl-N-acetylglucosamine deacetylase [Aquabacter spiritensis]TCT06700.1 UDP-3-O-[3-hydroxymyristoyl] N-acetylglucosamine deacetylase [Aquabacter spiritensis]
MTSDLQTTLAGQAALKGAGVHAGVDAHLVLKPAGADTGIVFSRTFADQAPRRIAVSRQSVQATDLATVLGDRSGALVATVEHVLAALSGLGVDNAEVEIDGPEVPILDGSAAQIVAAVDSVGIAPLSGRRKYLKVLKPVRVENGASFGELSPYDAGCRLEVEIEFDHHAIGRQRFAGTLSPGVFRRELAPARTFGFLRDVERLRGAGYALGASLDNTVCLDADGVMNAEGLRFSDEFVRHKALDAVGDLALAGLPLLARYRSFRGGHKLNFQVVDALLADRSAFAVVEAPARTRREAAELSVGGSVGAPVLAYAPER